MRFCFVLPATISEGPAAWYRTIAAGLVERGHHLRLFIVQPGRASTNNALPFGGDQAFEIERLLGPGSLRRRAWPALWRRRLATRLRAMEPDVLQIDAAVDFRMKTLRESIVLRSDWDSARAPDEPALRVEGPPEASWIGDAPPRALGSGTVYDEFGPVEDPEATRAWRLDAYLERVDHARRSKRIRADRARRPDGPRSPSFGAAPGSRHAIPARATR